LVRELEKVGIRLNKRAPDIQVTINKTGGIQVISTCHLSRVDDRLIKNIFQEYKLHNATILIKEDITVDDIIDTIEGNRKYISCLYIYNKIDSISLEEVNDIARKEDSVVISC
jgi:ribosome-interacting GTPase 1